MPVRGRVVVTVRSRCRREPDRSVVTRPRCESSRDAPRDHRAHRRPADRRGRGAAAAVAPLLLQVRRSAARRRLRGLRAGRSPRLGRRPAEPPAPRAARQAPGARPGARRAARAGVGGLPPGRRAARGGPRLRPGRLRPGAGRQRAGAACAVRGGLLRGPVLDGARRARAVPPAGPVGRLLRRGAGPGRPAGLPGADAAHGPGHGGAAEPHPARLLAVPRDGGHGLGPGGDRLAVRHRDDRVDPGAATARPGADVRGRHGLLPVRVEPAAAAGRRRRVGGDPPRRLRRPGLAGPRARAGRGVRALPRHLGGRAGAVPARAPGRQVGPHPARPR